MGGTVKTHPAYGILGFSRVSGGPGKLYGSEIHHNSYIEMRLVPGEEHRTSSYTHHMGRMKPLVCVRMSHSQFAEAITSMNIGSGVPVTIDFIDDAIGQRPLIDDKTTLHKKVKAELSKEAKDAMADAEKLETLVRETLASSKLSKAAQKEVVDAVTRLTSSIRSSMPYVVESYQEAAEKVGANAKAELDAFATMVVTKLGTKALAALNEEPQSEVLLQDVRKQYE